MKDHTENLIERQRRYKDRIRWYSYFFVSYCNSLRRDRIQ